MVATPTQSRILKFALFEVDLEAGELRKSGMRQKLAGQPFEVLRLLLEHPQESSPAKNCSTASGRRTPLLITIWR